MSIKPFLIKPIASINPSQDRYWIPDGENMWFLPCVLDLINQTYSGYWYGSKDSVEDKHYHTGIAQGTVLHGEMQLICKNKKLTLKPNDSFLLPPNTIHSAKMIPDEKGFLIFGIIVGNTNYIDDEEFLGAAEYYELVTKYYSNYNIDMGNIALNLPSGSDYLK